ncbi:Ig-like domain-containing protein, partial [Magnetococcales bacterium HHB-1]
DFIEGISRQGNRVWLNDGSGTFTDSGQSLTKYSDETEALVLGDFDGDGDLDFIEGNDSANPPNHVWINDGSGTFAATDQSLGDHNTESLAVGDMDGDGDLDLIEGNIGEANRIWLNDGSGSFTDSGLTLGDHDNESVTVGDVDGDGDLDLIEGSPSGASRVWLNQTSLTSHTPATNALDITASNNVSLTFGSNVTLTQDTNFHIFGSLSGKIAGSFSNNGTSTVTFDPTSDFEPGETITVLVNDDIATETFQFTVAAGDATTADAPGVFADSGQTLGDHGTMSIVVADIDGDGDLDLIEGTWDQGHRIWKNDGSGTFTDSGQALGDTYSPSIVLGDIDGDGDLDLIESGSNRIWENDGS